MRALNETVVYEGPALAVVPGSHRVSRAGFNLLVDLKPRIGSNRKRVAGAAIIASMIVGVVFIVVLLVLPPIRGPIPVEVTMPEKTRTIILEDLALAPPPRTMPSAPELSQVNVQRVAEPEVPEGLIQEPVRQPDPPKRRPEVDPDAGKVGRARAQEATKQLAVATRSLDKALGDLSASLGKDGAYEPTRSRRARNVRGGRSDGQLGGLETGSAASGAGADLGNSRVEGSLVAIGALAAPKGDDAGLAGSSGSTVGAPPGVYRSNASLLAVINKYAAGIQYCYSNELKRDPTLKGKLVVTLVVAASGEVTDATVVQNTVGSSQLASCALSQIKEWKFPAITGGVTTFRTPFVFTPPD